MSDQDPAVGTWQAAVERSYAESTRSTSAHARRLEEQLDQARRDYNAELAARVAAEKERDRFIAAADKLNGEWLDLKTKLRFALHDAEHCAAERDRALAENAENAWLRMAAQWIVARDGGRSCERCEQEIRRGEAYQYLAVNELRHVHCPDPKEKR